MTPPITIAELGEHNAGAPRRSRQTESQMAIGLVLSALGLGGLCFLLVRSTIYALPVFAGVVAGFWANGTGAGPIGAIGVAVIVAGATFGAFQVAFGLARNAAARVLIAFVFAAPAAYAGYHVVLTLARYGVPSEIWRHVFAVGGATIIGIMAILRLFDSLDAQKARPSSP
jgi:hypothetical protein